MSKVPPKNNIPRLFEAIEHQDIRVLETLVKYVDLRGYFYCPRTYLTPLERACQIGFANGVECLIKHGAIVSYATDSYAFHKSLLDLAIYSKSLETVTVLCNAGVPVNTRSGLGCYTPLHLAVLGDQVEICKELVKRGANIYIQDKQKKIPFHYCITLGKLSILEFFLERFPTLIHVPNSKGWLPIHKARDAEVLRILLRFGANVHSKNEQNLVTPLHRAVYDNYFFSIIQLLVEHGARVNEEDKYHHTVFGVLWDGRYLQCHQSNAKIRHLLENGADPSKDRDIKVQTRSEFGSLKQLQQNYKVNVCIQLLVACTKIKRCGAQCKLDLLPVDMLRVLHTFLR